MLSNSIACWLEQKALEWHSNSVPIGEGRYHPVTNLPVLPFVLKGGSYLLQLVAMIVEVISKIWGRLSRNVDEQVLQQQVKRLEILVRSRKEEHAKLEKQVEETLAVVTPLESIVRNNIDVTQQVKKLVSQDLDGLRTFQQKAEQLNLAGTRLAGLSEQMKELTNQERLKRDTAELLKLVDVLIVSSQKGAELATKVKALESKYENQTPALREAEQNLKQLFIQAQEVVA